MADAGREVKFRDAVLVLADDASDGAAKLRKYIRQGAYQQAEAMAGSLQRTARDAKWLMRRLPKQD